METAANAAGNTIKRSDSKLFSIDHLSCSLTKNSKLSISPKHISNLSTVCGYIAGQLSRQPTAHEIVLDSDLSLSGNRSRRMSAADPILGSSNSGFVGKFLDSESVHNPRTEAATVLNDPLLPLNFMPIPTVGINELDGKQLKITNEITSDSIQLAGNVVSGVKETNDVKRNVVHLPEQIYHPRPTAGDWINRRYFVNDYILLGTLGKGSYGEVRLCRHRDCDQSYAMKIISKDVMRKKKNGNIVETFFEDIKREIAIMKKLLHPNVLRLFEVLNDPKVNIILLLL